ncbi:DUF1330 domain-containing protein [Acinetobacter colistiniresistens]|uniref:DUF1330 domain-containing protein n=1 Tax=Acinetobacter colistiniresistens TaxID=280145 RepID=A0A558F3I2_9GAMM|nr:DUF1330 domain-containing protein [Acinetobacter colistiniresistens]TVT79799.1 DUF1330 domain-containing protein [Acinetobacter colistiniresistens]
MAAYWIAHITVDDMQQYQQYMQLAPAAFQKYGAKFLARGGDSVNLEGQAFKRHVLIEFADLATAQACYDSIEYKAARNAREGSADVMISIVEA